MTEPGTYPLRAAGVRFGRSVFRGGLAWWMAVLLAAALMAWVTMMSLQLGCTVAMAALAVGLYAYDRRSALFTVWAVWFLAPFVRRVFFIEQEPAGSDPLALAPFLVTALVIGLELTRVKLSPRARRIVAFALVGFALGIPFGLRASPQAAAFAFFAYTTGVGCFVLGYAEGWSGKRPTVVAALIFVTPLLALYAFRQYFGDLPEWDQVWLDESGINSAGSDDRDRVRVWSTLNSPGTFASVLGVACVVSVATMRLNLFRLVGVLLVFGALALTYVRSAWIGVVFAVVAMTAVSRGVALKRVIPVLVVIAALGPVVFGGSTGAALGERADTFGSLGSDESAEARVSTPRQVVPIAIKNPLGLGLGTAGEASQLSSAGGFRSTDNALLSLILQLGPFGFVLVLSAIAMSLRSAFMRAWKHPRGPDVMILGVLSFTLCTMLAGDQLYGVSGMFFWFMCGLAVRRSEPAST